MMWYESECGANAERAAPKSTFGQEQKRTGWLEKNLGRHSLAHYKASGENPVALGDLEHLDDLKR